MMNAELNVYLPYYIVSIQEKESWDYYIQNSITYDFYHTWHYHSLEKCGEPFLFVYHKKEGFIALPLIKRKIEGTNFYDCTSAYGYVGPVSNIPFTEMDKATIFDFRQSFHNYLESERIVSVFSRLHPFINQHLLLNGLDGVLNNGKTVTIDLRLSIDEQRAKYRRAIRQKIKQLRKNGYQTRVATTAKEIIEFVRIYHENMAKVNASLNYLFDEKYFLDILNSADFESKLLLACKEDKITSGGLITFFNGIMQFHLAATANQFLSDCPMKLLFDEASMIGRESGMSFLHLGGGVGGQEDSLFHFKAGFSDTFLTFNTWRYIANLPVYTALVEERFSNQEANYNKFPLYRF